MPETDSCMPSFKVYEYLLYVLNINVISDNGRNTLSSSPVPSCSYNTVLIRRIQYLFTDLGGLSHNLQNPAVYHIISVSPFLRYVAVIIRPKPTNS